MMLMIMQIACALLAVTTWLAWVAPALRRQGSPLVTDIWGPVALCAPAFWATSLVELDVQPVGDGFIAGPVLIGAFAVGFGLLVQPADSDRRAPLVSRFTLGAWLSGFVVLLLLAALNELSVWVGQTIFAVSIVLLWCQTPSLPQPGEEPDDHARSPTSGLALIAVILFACAQGWAWQRAGLEQFTIGLVIFLAGMTATLIGTVVLAGRAGIRLAGWVALLGPLLGVGILSLGRMLPVAIELTRSEGPVDEPPPLYVAFGLGHYAVDLAIGLLLVGVVALSAWLLGRLAQVSGLVLMTAAVIMFGWRVIGWL